MTVCDDHSFQGEGQCPHCLAIGIGDLFDPQPSERHPVPPSESVYTDMGLDELFYLGEIQVPRPLPVELVVEIDGWDYYFKLSRREKSQ